MNIQSLTYISIDTIDQSTLQTDVWLKVDVENVRGVRQRIRIVIDSITFVETYLQRVDS